MIRLILIRHGETDMNRTGCLFGDTDIELSQDDTSIKNIKDLADSLNIWSPGIKIVLSSPLKRAMQTAEVIADSLKIGTIITHPDLRELSFGDWEGKKYPEINGIESEKWSTRDITPDTKPVNGESFAQIADRIEKVLNEICLHYNNTTIIIVTHVYVIKAALDRAMNLSDGYHANRLWLDTASATIIDWNLDRNKRIVHRVNWTSNIAKGIDKWNKIN